MQSINIYIRMFSKKSFVLPKVNFKYKHLQNVEEQTDLQLKTRESSQKQDFTITQELDNISPIKQQGSHSLHSKKWREKEHFNNFTSSRKLKTVNTRSNYFISKPYFSSEEEKHNHVKKKSLSSGFYITDKKRESALRLNEDNNEILYGIYPVLLSLHAKQRFFYNLYFKKDILQKNSNFQEIYELCQSNGIATHSISKNKLKELSGTNSVNQGVCLEVSPLPVIYFDHQNWDAAVDHKKSHLWLYLDKIMDPMNMGALLRSAYFLGVDKVLSSTTNSCPITSVVSKASAGVAEIFQVYRICDDNILAELKKSGWQIVSSVSSSSKNSIDIDQFHPNQNTLLIAGNEGSGISEHLMELSDAFITVSAQKHCSPYAQTLNVSVATSVLTYSILSKQRLQYNTLKTE